MGGLSDFLYARPSFVEGAARILDFGNTLTEYNQALTAEQADAIAMRQDWAAVGKDIRAAAELYQRQIEAERQAEPPPTSDR
jgi:hypothetical protein